MNEPAPPDSSRLLSKHRIEALSDGMFAVVMTLLVLEIKPELGPHSDDEAVRHLLQILAIPVLTFAIAFLISSVFWSLHHRKFALLRNTNPVHTGLTLVFLFTVTLLPVSVSIYLHAKSSSLARAVYFGNFTLIAVSLLVSWLYARRAGLVDPAQPDALVRRLTLRMVAIAAMGVIATVSSYVDMTGLYLLAVPIIIFLRFPRRTSATP
jgi:uncharacterized membrane protein